MRSIKTKMILGILLCALVASGITEVISINNAQSSAEVAAAQNMVLGCENEAEEIDAGISRIEQSVDTLSDIIMREFDYNSFVKSKSYADQFTESISDLVDDFAAHTEGAISAYVRYNPDYSNPTSGIFATRSSVDEAFTFVEPTDFSMYEKDDVEHVGWYYIPVENKAPLWMSPYLNANINIYMISYVVPLYAEDCTSIGIVGMDIDFNQLTQMTDAISVYDTGYAFLTDADGTVMHHKELEINQELAE